VIPAPVLLISVTSSLLPNAETSSSRAPSEIRFPDFLDLETCYDGGSPFCQDIVLKYDLVSVISSSGSDLSRLSLHFKTDLNAEDIWRGGSVGSDIDVISKSRAVSGNFYGSSESKTHPRLLVYIRRDFPEFLEELHIDEDTDDPSENDSSVGKYRGTSKRGYDENAASVECAACASNSCSICASGSGMSQSSNKSDDGSDLHDYEAPRPSLLPIAGLTASALEEQADLALANRRLKDAVDIYSRAISACGSSGSSSENQKSLQEKRERVSRLIRLDTSVLLVEKGERALHRGAYGDARSHYIKAAHSQSDITHLKLIIAEIDQNIKLQTAQQKIIDAHAAMRAGQYQSADDLFRHAIALNPEKAATLESIQATLAPLIRTENAATKQKIGMQAFEEKRFQDALNILSEAIGLLPESSPHLAAYYCDRAAIFCELKDFPSAIVNCEQALAIQGDFATAYLRMGTACFGCEKLDDALANYEKAVKLDQSLVDQVKVKIRQVNTAREVQQRKERENERARQREDEQRAIQEKRMREEQQKKEKAEKLALEKSEKLERQRQKDEEKRLKAEKEKAELDVKLKEKEAEKEKLREERLKKEAERLQEREAQKLEKERDRERQKLEKEQRRLDQQRVLEEEKRRKDEFAQEMARVEQARKEVERQKEAEKEKARIEMENLIAEREKTRTTGAAAAEASTAESSSAVRSNCSKCSLVIDGSARFYALGHCNHRTVCSVCSLRMRSSTFGETVFSCVECKVNLDCVVCTVSDQPFSKFQVPGNPGPDLQYDKKSRIFFPKEYFRTVVDKIWKFSCRHCQFESLDMDAFSKHMLSSHKQSVCQLCFKNNRQFPSEIDTYSAEAFEKHLTGVPETENELTGGGHPKCGHCNQLFYDETQLLVHLNDSHVSCNLCNPEIVIKTQGDSASRAAHLSGLFCPDAKDLRNHHIALHYLCQNLACRDKLVVFKTQNELDDHTSAIHTVSYRPVAAYYPGLQGSPPPTGAPSFIPSGFLAAPAVASGIPTSSLPVHSGKWMGQSSPSVGQLATPSLPSWNLLPGSSRGLDVGLFDNSDPLSADGGDLNQFGDSNFPQTSTFNVKAAEFKPSFAVQSSLLSKGLEGSSGSTGNLADLGIASTSSYQLDIVQGMRSVNSLRTFICVFIINLYHFSTLSRTNSWSRTICGSYEIIIKLFRITIWFTHKPGY
jgi:tetratricopeptide (TPR) repeat protein